MIKIYKGLIEFIRYLFLIPIITLVFVVIRIYQETNSNK